MKLSKLRRHAARPIDAIALAAALAAGAISAGCASHPWYLVESQFIESTREEKAPEVTGTPAYYHKFRGPLRVALRAPDSCANQSAAEASGDADSAGELLRTRCGVEMAEMERALAKAGYTVSSWNAVWSIVHFEETTPRKAAEQLGAQILFQVNSLERGGSNPGRDLRRERTFYMSNERGEKLGEAFVEEERAATLEAAMEPIENQNLPPQRMSATVNVSAVDVATGESIWFYQWTVIEDREQEHSAEQLFECNKSNLRVCRYRKPLDARDDTRMTRSGGLTAVSIGAGEEDERDAVYHRLVRRVVEDLVQRFTEDRG